MTPDNFDCASERLNQRAKKNGDLLSEPRWLFWQQKILCGDGP